MDLVFVAVFSHWKVGPNTAINTYFLVTQNSFFQKCSTKRYFSHPKGKGKLKIGNTTAKTRARAHTQDSTGQAQWEIQAAGYSQREKNRSYKDNESKENQLDMRE